ncbi:hypothetical protein [Rhizobium rhizoryzae]|uniref:Head-tail adaptor protein n=1 Tax=Rhizobium rhizoryzae TaxID=451876 RepID=A0A7W6LFC7_9HYPH|nr:hypothetical protein [Rhizobium rhizoryzae]MBB4143226.1 hypothetical protein [Rhizobium rhizoryzae]
MAFPRITIRSQPAAKAVNTSWSICDSRSGLVFNVKLIKPDQRGAFLAFIAESGTA